MDRPVLVTGASGRAGGAVAAALGPLARPAKRRPDGPGQVRFDFTDPATHDPALRGCGAVFLMRPPAITRGRTFEPFLDAMARTGVRRIVVMSVRGADRIPVLPHHAMERAVRARDLDWTMLRPADFMQNLETAHRAAIRDRDEIAVPAGHGASPFVDVADIGATVAKVLSEPGHRHRGYTLTGPEDLDFDAVAAILSQVLDRRIRYRPVSIPRFVKERRAAGDPTTLALVMSAVYSAQRLGLAAGPTGDLPRLLGRPASDMVAYARRVADLWRP